MNCFSVHEIINQIRNFGHNNRGKIENLFIKYILLSIVTYYTFRLHLREEATSLIDFYFETISFIFIYLFVFLLLKNDFFDDLPLNQ